MALKRAASTMLKETSMLNGFGRMGKRCIATAPTTDGRLRPVDEESDVRASYGGGGGGGRSFNEMRRGDRPAQRHFYLPATEQIVEHLESTFAPVRFPEGLALRIATHKSAAGALGNHNTRLSLLGRRFLRFTTASFINMHADKLKDKANYISDESLVQRYRTRELGSSVGERLALQRSMRWLAVRDHEGLETGLSTIRGTMVEAVIGGVFRQYGAAQAQNLIYTYIFPHMVLPEELEEVVEEARRKGAAKLGR